MTRSPDTLSANGNDPTPRALAVWRARVLDWVLRGALIFWLGALALGLFTIFQVGRQNERLALAWVITGFYLCLMAVLVGITFAGRLGYQRRAILFLAAIYVLGVSDWYFRGYSGDSRVFLLAFVALAAILLDLRYSAYALLLAVLTLLMTGLLHLYGIVTRLPFSGVPDVSTGWSWLSSLIIFTVMGTTAVLSITYLIRSLDESLSQARKEQGFASAVLEASGVLVVAFDPAGRIERFNRACEEVTGYTAAEVIGAPIWDLLLTPDGADLLRTAIAQMSADGRPTRFDSYWLTRTGERRLIAWSSAVVLDENGRVEHIINTGVDLTGQKQSEAEKWRLLAAENEQRLLSETLTEATLSITAQTQPEDVLDQILRQVQRIVPFTAAHITLLENETLRVVRWQGYQERGGDETISRLIQSLDALPLEQNVVTSRKPMVIGDTRQNPLWVVFPETAWVRSHLVVPILQPDRVLGLLRLDGDAPGQFGDQDAERLQHLATTIAIALQNAQLLQEAQQKARQVQRILDTVQDGILLLDAQYHVELANPAAQAHLTLLTSAGLGKPLTLIGNQSIRDLVQPPRYGASWHEINLQKPPRTFEAAAQPMETSSGGWVLVLRDITEARQQQQYAEAQERLAMVGQMAAGIAHDFNNIMTVIILYAQMLLKAPNLPADLAGRLETVFTQSKLATNLIGQILDFSRHGDMQQRPVHLRPFLKELTKLLRRTLPENIELQLDYDEGEYTISADITRIQQAVMNLVMNARDAMPQGGTVRLDLTKIEVMEGGKRPLPDMPPGHWIRLQVGDDGIGIPPENLPRIFEPLFTTKERGKGTGLGLPQVHGIIKQHQGFIGVESIVDEGTTISLYFPPLTETDSYVADAEEIGSTRGAGELILVVEDDQITREAICAILEAYNYRTVAASDGAEALRLFDFFSTEIALVLSDMVMPGMSGSALYAQLSAQKPGTKMIIITGYPFADEDREVLSQGVVRWLQKPFEVDQITTAIQETLAAAP